MKGNLEAPQPKIGFSKIANKETLHMSILGKMSKILFKLSSFRIKGKIKLTKNIKKVLIIIIKDLLLTNVDFRSTGIGRIIAIKVSFELVRIIDKNIKEIYKREVILL